jgi:hypothetical protein
MGHKAPGRRRRASFEVARERERLAARVNCVVSEALREMVDDAGRGLHLLASDRPAAASALAGIESTGREALTEMRALLGVLRTNPGSGPQTPQIGSGPHMPHSEASA